jgi:ketosteroid isomerase-like protein
MSITAPDLSIIKTEHPNLVRTREAFQAFGRGELDVVRANMTDDCTWTNEGTSPLAGTHRGWDEIAAMFGRLFTLTDGTFSMDVQSLFADDARACAIYDATATVGGVTATYRWVLTDELDSDGKVTATYLFCYDQAAADAHLAGASA